MAFKKNLRMISKLTIHEFCQQRMELWENGKQEGYRRLLAPHRDFFVDYQIVHHAKGFSYSLHFALFQSWSCGRDDYDYATRQECLETLIAHVLYDLEDDRKDLIRYDKSDWRINEIEKFIKSVEARRTLFGIDEPEEYGTTSIILPFKNKNEPVQSV